MLLYNTWVALVTEVDEWQTGTGTMRREEPYAGSVIRYAVAIKRVA